MLRNLKAEMVRTDLSVAEMSQTINKSDQTTRDKLAGKSDFSISEAFRIRDAHFPDMDLEYLFAQSP